MEMREGEKERGGGREGEGRGTICTNNATTLCTLCIHIKLALTHLNRFKNDKVADYLGRE